MKKNDIIEISRQYSLNPSKTLGQNFLVSEEITSRIIDLLRLEGEKKVLEVGPGLGSLTGPVADSGCMLTVVEIDSGFVRYLTDQYGEKGNVRIIHADFLKTRIEDDFQCVVSNLPYYCSSEILFRIATELTVPDVFVMLQRELAERITSTPGEKSYGALTVNLSAYFRASRLFDIPRSAFYPRPDVMSSFLHLKREERVADPAKREVFHNLVKSAFWGRRKTILKSLSSSPHLEISREKAAGLLDAAGIDKKIRGEELGRDDFIYLADIAVEEGII